MIKTKINKPNIVFINTDQQRFDTLGCYGAKTAKTPNIDRLADEGVLFESCYTTNPVCMPARASWFTGQYPSRHGCWNNGVPLNPESDLIQDRLKKIGYNTALIGKIHLDNIWLRQKKHPAYGFDSLMECEGDPFCKDDYFQWLDEQGLYESYMKEFKANGHNKGYTRTLTQDKHMNNWITNHVKKYFQQQAAGKEPFFLSIGFFDPHHPFDPCEPYASNFSPNDMPIPVYQSGEEDLMTPSTRARYETNHEFCQTPDKIKKTKAAYYATINHVDAMIGNIMQYLEDTGLEEKTIVVFTSDHGELLGDHGLLHKGGAEPLFYEGAIKVPLIYRFPKHCKIKGIKDTSFVSHVDLAPTIAELTDIGEFYPSQGHSLFDKKLNLRPNPPRDYALIEFRERKINSSEKFFISRCIITEEWKYIYYHNRNCGELYNRKEDPNEFKNLWGLSEYKSKVALLKDKLFQCLIEADSAPVRKDIF